MGETLERDTEAEDRPRPVVVFTEPTEKDWPLAGSRRRVGARPKRLNEVFA